MSLKVRSVGEAAPFPSLGATSPTLGNAGLERPPRSWNPMRQDSSLHPTPPQRSSQNMANAQELFTGLSIIKFHGPTMKLDVIENKIWGI